MTHPAAWSSMFLSAIAFALLLWKKTPNKIGLLALLSFTTYFGLCYIRGTGYAAIAAAFVIAWIVANQKQNEESLKGKKYTSYFRTIIAGVSFVACLALLGGILTLVVFKKSEFFFREKERCFGFGKAVCFEDAPYAFVKKYFPDAPCFTTIMTGSYASFFGKIKKFLLMVSLRLILPRFGRTIIRPLQRKISAF